MGGKAGDEFMSMLSAGGVRFDQKRFGRDMALFHKKVRRRHYLLLRLLRDAS